MRDVWIFPIKNIDDVYIIIDTEIINNNYNKKSKKAHNLTYKELVEKAEESESKNSGCRKTVSKTYDRNVYVTELAKRRANGIYQLCN